MHPTVNASITLLIKPASYRCNIECAYCFYKRVGGVYPCAGSMDLATAENLIRKTLSLGFDQNNFCWQGGEPTLMGIDFYKHVVDLQKRYAQPGQIIGNTIQTNGVLIDPSWAEFFFKNRFFIGLSLDGPDFVHDHYRKSASGKGTFEKVMRAAGLLTAEKVEFNILSLLTDANISRPETLYRFFRRNGLNHLQFIPCVESDPVTKEPMPYAVSGEQLGNFYRTLFDLWMKDGFREVSIRAFEDILIYYIDRIHTSCSGLEKCGAYLVVEHNGDVYPCDFFVYPEWKLGNLTEDTYSKIFNNHLLKKFSELKADIPEPCAECRWLAFCRGDCTRLRRDGNGGFGNLSLLCSAQKMLLDHMESHLESIKEKALRIRRRNRIERSSRVMGRNAMCPCNSGLKYKKCCGK
jgi:uncharacterized protein